MIRYKYTNRLRIIEDHLNGKKLDAAKRMAQSLYDADNAEEMYTREEMEFIKVVIGLGSLDKLMKKLDKKGRKRGDVVSELMKYPDKYKEN